jgi:predicted  nucleic acid-binding Zn-ribbon protein
MLKILSIEILNYKRLFCCLLFCVPILGGCDSGNHNPILGENSEQIKKINTFINDIGNQIINLEKDKEILGNELIKVKEASNAIKNLTDNEKEEYKKYKNMSIYEHMQIATRNSFCSIANNKNSDGLKEICILHSDSVVNYILEYIRDNKNLKKWSSSEDCMKNYLNKISQIHTNKKISEDDIDEVKKLILKGEEYQKNQEEKKKKYTELENLVRESESNIYTIESKTKEIDKKIETLTENANNAIAIMQLKTGKIKPGNIQEYAVLYDANDSEEYCLRPPLDGPTDKKKYYFWNGTLAKKEGDQYFVWDTFMGKSSGFIFQDIKINFSELRQNAKVYVVGRYSKNGKVKLVNGQERIIPILTDCFVDVRR